jgi:hypothetical protein
MRQRKIDDRLLYSWEFQRFADSRNVGTPILQGVAGAIFHLSESMSFPVARPHIAQVAYPIISELPAGGPTAAAVLDRARNV